jgi:hypothetical protein
LLVIAFALKCATAAETTANEAWPEVDALRQSQRSAAARYAVSILRHDDTLARDANFGFLFDVALKPVFRHELRDREDMFNKRSYRSAPAFDTQLLSTTTRPKLRIAPSWSSQRDTCYRDKSSYRPQSRRVPLISGQSILAIQKQAQLENTFQAADSVFTP